MEQLERMTCGFGEIKFAGEGAAVTRKFSGHGAVFKNIDSYGDVIEPGAFAGWLSDVKAGKQEWPAMLSQHGAWGMTTEDLTPVGAWLDLFEDGTGLGVEGELAETQRGNDLHVLMRMKPRPAIKGLSIGYIAKKYTMGTKPTEPRRKLHEIVVREISPVTFPANLKAKVSSVKSIEQLTSMREVEDFLCDGGMSKAQALALISRIKGIGQGDPAGAGGPGDPAAMATLMASLERRASALR